MKTAIVYYSRHHGNTRKLLDAIAENNEVTLIDITAEPNPDLTQYDRIGFASGIYYSKFAKSLISLAKEHLPENREVFLSTPMARKRRGTPMRFVRLLISMA